MGVITVFKWEEASKADEHYIHIYYDERRGVLDIEAGGFDGAFANVRLPQDKIAELIQSLCKVPVHKALAGTFPVVCYFGNTADRDEFVELVKGAKPGMRAVKP